MTQPTEEPPGRDPAPATPETKTGSEGESVPRPDEGALNLLFDEVADELNRQFTQNEALVGRAQQILGFGAAILGLAVTLRPPTERLLITLLFAGALALFLLLAREAWSAWTLKRWRTDPRAARLWEDYRAKTEEYIRHQIILNRLQAIATNEKNLDEKIRHLKNAGILLVLEVLYLVGLVMLRPYL